MEKFSCENLSFYYGKKLILNNVNFIFKPGDVVGLVGVNGAGKTTLLKLMAGIISSVFFTGTYCSFFVDGVQAYPYMTAKENLELYSNFFNQQLFSCDEALKMVGLYNYSKLKVKKYSFGMKQRLGIAMCVIKEANIYLFDEPLNGLDLEGIALFEKIITHLKTKNKIVVISSHLLSELCKYCNKIIYLNNDKCHIFEANIKENLRGIQEDICSNI